MPIWLCKCLVCYYLSLLKSDSVGDTHLPISWQKGGLVCDKGVLVVYWMLGRIACWGGVPHLRGALHCILLHDVACFSLMQMLVFIFHLITSNTLVLESVVILYCRDVYSTRDGKLEDLVLGIS